MLLSKATVKKSNSLLEKLNYLGMLEGVVFSRDGHMEFAIELSLPSSAEVGDADRDAISEALRLILMDSVPEEARVRLLIESSQMRPEALIDFKNRMHSESDLLEEISRNQVGFLERMRVSGQLRSWRTFFTVRLKAPKKDKKSAYFETPIKRMVEHAKAVRRRLAGTLGTAGFAPIELQDQQCYELMWRYFNPGIAQCTPPLYTSFFSTGEHTLNQIERDEARIDPKTLRRQLLENALDNTRQYALWVGDRMVSTVSMQEAGSSTRPGMLEQMLRRIPGTFICTIDIEHPRQRISKDQLVEKLRSAQANSEELSMGGGNLVTNDARMDRLSDALYTLEAAGEHLFNFGVCVVLVARERDELEEMKETVRNEISNLGGAKVLMGTFQNLTQWLAVAPLGGRNNEFLDQGLSRNVSDLIPLVGSWRGSHTPFSLYPNRWGGLTGLNPASESQNYGTVVIGSAGSGKTFAVQDMLGNFRAMGAELIITDMKRDYVPFVTALGGEIIPLIPGAILPGKTQKVAINIFDLPRGEWPPKDPGNFQVSEEKQMVLMGFLNTAFEGESLDRDLERALMQDAVNQTYRIAARRGDRVPILSDFKQTLTNMNAIGSQPMTPELKALALRLAIKLENFTGTSALGTFLDAQSTVDIENPVCYFDLSRFKDDEQLKRIGLLLVTNLMWKRAKENPAVIKVPVIEEFGVLLQIPEAAEFVNALYKLGRAYNLWPIAVSQEIGDMQGARGILNNTSTVFIGKVSPYEADQVADILGLKDSARALIKSLGGERGRYREYFVQVTKENAREGDVIQLWPSKMLYWLLTTNPIERSQLGEALNEYRGNLTEALRSLAGERQKEARV